MEKGTSVAIVVSDRCADLEEYYRRRLERISTCLDKIDKTRNDIHPPADDTNPPENDTDPSGGDEALDDDHESVTSDDSLSSDSSHTSTSTAATTRSTHDYMPDHSMTSYFFSLYFTPEELEDFWIDDLTAKVVAIYLVSKRCHWTWTRFQFVVELFMWQELFDDDWMEFFEAKLTGQYVHAQKEQAERLTQLLKRLWCQV